MLDVSSPVGKAIFWSGDRTSAEAYAKSVGGVTLETTPGVSLVNGWKWLETKYPDYAKDRKPIWKALSTVYASNAKGEVTYVHPTNYYGDIWLRTELPILKMLEKYEIVKLNEVVIDGAEKTQ